MNWKKILFFSRGEKNGILVLLCLIVVVIAVNRALPWFFSEKATDVSVYQEEIENFKASLELKNEPLTYPFVKVQRELFRFDPNKLDSAGFVRLGISPYLVTRILKYRSKGGVFRKKEDFSKIYGMEEALYRELSSYIFVEDDVKKASSEEKKSVSATEKKVEYIAQKIETIELNKSDTASLKTLKGIGAVYADRIVKYRDYLGGFYQVEQLTEVYGISEELFQSLKPYLTVDNSQIKKIRLNQSDLPRLRHPYLKKEQLSALVSFRQKNGVINSFEVLSELVEFSDSDWERLRPYLSLE